MPAGPIAQYRIASTFHAVRTLLTDLGDRLSGQVDEATLARLELCLAEALNNIVEHGYQENPNGEILVDTDWDGEAVRTRITDFGRSSQDANGAYPEPVQGQPDDLKEGGYGLSLIHTIASRIDYNSEGGRNTTTIWQSIGAVYPDTQTERFPQA